jgi:hypothetical protein
LADGITLPAGAIYQYVLIRPLKAKENKPVSVAISLRPAVLEKLDAAAAEEGLTRSGFIALAAQHYIKSLEK